MQRELFALVVCSHRYVIFVDDVNMPQREVYGAQPPIEILRFWLGHGGWYDRKTQEWHKIIDIGFVGAMGPPGGGRQIVTNRFLRYFSFISFPELEDASMTQIFSRILNTFVDAYLSPDILPVVQPMIEATLDLYATLLKELLPTPAKSHYTFNLRDIASVVQGLLSANTKQMDGPDDLLRLWVHENLRVFRDRLVNDDDRTWFDKTIKGLIPKHFVGDTFAKADSNNDGRMQWEEVVKCDITHLIYGDFMDPNVRPAPGLTSELREIRAPASFLTMRHLMRHSAACNETSFPPTSHAPLAPTGNPHHTTRVCACAAGGPEALLRDHRRRQDGHDG